MSTDLQAFLVLAKAATYAAQGDNASVDPAFPATKQLEYSAGRFFYRDVYAGMSRFAGQEMVYEDGIVVWSMAYSGGLTTEAGGEGLAELYAFLRRALLAPASELPVRGPKLLSDGELRYDCVHEGALELFHGTEHITRSGVVLYELRFSGGAVR
jgi:hypothetical protein